jgi:hypothetical protein
MRGYVARKGDRPWGNRPTELCRPVEIIHQHKSMVVANIGQ